MDKEKTHSPTGQTIKKVSLPLLIGNLCFKTSGAAHIKQEAITGNTDAAKVTKISVSRNSERRMAFLLMFLDLNLLTKNIIYIDKSPIRINEKISSIFHIPKEHSILRPINYDQATILN